MADVARLIGCEGELPLNVLVKAQPTYLGSSSTGTDGPRKPETRHVGLGIDGSLSV
jgi:hypothetical protein